MIEPVYLSCSRSRLRSATCECESKRPPTSKWSNQWSDVTESDSRHCVVDREISNSCFVAFVSFENGNSGKNEQWASGLLKVAFARDLSFMPYCGKTSCHRWYGYSGLRWWREKIGSRHDSRRGSFEPRRVPRRRIFYASHGLEIASKKTARLFQNMIPFCRM